MYAITLPFTVDGFGRVSVSRDNDRVWRDRVRSVIGTSLGERVMRPTFGSQIPLGLFDILNEAPELLDGYVSTAFATWLPALSLESVNVVRVSRDDASIEIEVTYRVPTGEVDSASLGLVVREMQ